MRTAHKLLLAAVVLLCVGVAVASPTFLFQDTGVMDYDAGWYDSPQLGTLEGPKAVFSVEPVYAQFTIIGDHGSLNETNPRFVIDYKIVLNITNLSDREAEMTHADFAAAEEIKITPAVLADVLFSRAGETATGSCGGMVEGVWLDEQWVHSTWLPGKDYPSNLFREIKYEHTVTTIIPDLPLNATEEGTWINAVPIAQYRNASGVAAVHMYIDGTWIDATGRVRADPEQPFLHGTNTLIGSATTFSVEHYPVDYNNIDSFTSNMTGIPSQLWKMSGDNAMSYRWAYGMEGNRGFDCTWQPQQSRLVMLNASRTVFSTSGLDALESGEIMLYAAVANYVSNPPVNGVFSDNSLTAFWIKNIQLENTPDGYVYNNILHLDETFQTGVSGLEAFVVPKSSISVNPPLGNQTSG
jgi:hypothetical protein